ncbi:hypothetical protein LEP1GSC050_0070 [Leptospira phage vB_LbrZ_5399-LE1]|uniref:Abasic site processing protein n=1 Tax=Leptospira inadai serovar Lyme TaxID=293084 RepID=A0ABX4YGE5_9LEPT|nr:SOS response-associated peptidase family protein [Leptospira inadai]AGS80712.1 hypothetical protein LEP1GSC050_0070 [Leptospira phage vB_LbrZ_5399-LE1]AGS80787.1 hypothetical protein LEP1GSC047_0899 [Leptospira phage vB_LinZ_10-LE1]PNV74333.1 DUF159 family protein [Leptospira inadai serovar Lyme]
MCGRYSLNAEVSQIIEQFVLRHDIERIQREYRKEKVITPGVAIPVIREIKGNRKLEYVRWTVENFKYYDKSKKEMVKKSSGPPNARYDKLLDFKYWRKGLQNRRCIVPATSYWEWPDNPDEYKAGKVYKFHFKNRELMAFPGIICPYRDKQNVRKVGVMTITFDAEPHAKEIHRTQPALLLRENYDAWLNPNTETPERYLYKAKGIELDYELDEDPPWPTKKIKPEVKQKDYQPRLFD